jgi:hypothetical protein
VLSPERPNWESRLHCGSHCWTQRESHSRSTLYIRP